MGKKRKMNSKAEVLAVEAIARVIHVVHGHRVMLEFELSREEILRMSQIVTSSPALKFSKRVHVFTEQGVAMLSSVLHSERAVRVNIAIMRAFVKLRRMLDTNRELARQFAQLEARVGKQDAQLDAILEAIRELMEPSTEGPHREIGFHVREEGAGGRLRGMKLER